MIGKSAENDPESGQFLGRVLICTPNAGLASLNNESQNLARRAWTAFWPLVYAPLILYTGIEQNAPERQPDALKRKPHFKEHSGRENPLVKHTPQAVYLTFWGVFACAIEWLFMYDHINALGRV